MQEARTVAHEGEHAGIHPGAQRGFGEKGVQREAGLYEDKSRDYRQERPPHLDLVTTQGRRWITIFERNLDQAAGQAIQVN